MTEAEEKAWEEKMEARCRQVEAARAVIVAEAGPRVKGQTTSGRISPCPVCGKGDLRYRRAGSNGHIHAACTADGCVSWME